MRAHDLREKTCVAGGYKVTTKAYGRAVLELHGKMGSIYWSDDLRKIAIDAREQSERARRELEEHAVDHGC